MDRGRGLEIAEYDRAAETQYALIRDVMVPMRDGVCLATDLYLPAGRDGVALPGPFPVIVDRTPYEKVPRALSNDPEFFARRGYAFVFQDVRGHGDSEGEFYLYVHEGQDGYDCLEWVSKQPWCNGKIGTSGYSHDAATQNAIARAGSPHLTAMFPAFCSSNYHNDVAGHGGAQRLSHNFVYTIMQALLDRRAKQHPELAAAVIQAREDMFEWLKLHPDKHDRLFRDFPNAQQWYRDWLDHPDMDDYWKQNAYCFEGFYEDNVDIPAFFLGGYYDFCELGTVTNYEGLAAAKDSPQYLMLGPWCHGPLNARKRSAGTVDFGAESYIDWNHLRLAFFDERLMGIDTGMFAPDNAVRVFMMGGGSGRRLPAGTIDHGGYWLTSDQWPLPGITDRDYYLSDRYALTDAAQPAESTASYVYDPADPAIQLGGDYTYPFGVGPIDQIQDPSILGCTDTMPLNTRDDILTFETEPLTEDLEMSGHVWVELYVSTDAPDTDFTAKLIDQYPTSTEYPHGYAMLLTDSITRLRYRDSIEHVTPYTPGDIVKVRINVRIVSNLFKAGHRIRLDISSSNFPSFDPNPNTGEPIGKHTHQRPARNTIHLGGQHPSKLILPIRPVG
jgi:putative CocE/NonD family hydrolase